MRFAAAMFACLSLQAATAAMAADPSVEDMIQKLKPSSATDLTKSSYQGLVRIKGGDEQDKAPGSAPMPSANPTRVTVMASQRQAVSTPTGGLAALSLTVPFASGSATLLPSALPTLQRLGTALSSPDLAQYHFRIEGHTDTVGAAGYNRELSERRAETVAGYLEAHYGVQAARLQMVGLGFDQPAVATPPDTPEPRNRRVQIVNVGS